MTDSYSINGISISPLRLHYSLPPYIYSVT